MSRDYAPLLLPIVQATAGLLEDAGRPVSLAHLAPGAQVAWDNCCEGGGQLYLRVIEVYPTAGVGGTGFPGRDQVQRGPGCGVTMLAFNLGLGIIRCAHVVDDHGNAPSAEEMTGDTLGTLDDMGLLLDVLTCLVPATKGIARTSINAWTPQGPQGGCVGGEWTFWVGIDPCLAECG